jgi:hypothetical protein
MFVRNFFCLFFLNRVIFDVANKFVFFLFSKCFIFDGFI